MSSLRQENTLGDAVAVFDDPEGAVLVCDEQGRLLGSIGDFELRAAELAAAPMSTPVTAIMNRDAPVVVGSSNSEAAEIIKGRYAPSRFVIRVDEERRPLEVVPRSSLLPDERLIGTAILMVGGEGSRLRPLTEDVPKPLLPVAGVPIAERIVRALKQQGIDRIVMTLGYRGDQIEAHFKDGAAFDVSIEYVREERPLGTAGALGLVELRDRSPVLVMNGDILTSLDFKAMALWHRHRNAAVTMATRAHRTAIPYGVVRLVDGRVVSLQEKPIRTEWTNAGIYVMEPDVLEEIPASSYLDMTTVLLDRLIGSGRPVEAFCVREYWCDIGRPEDYERASRRYDAGG